MKRIIDISQEILSCKVFPGDPAPISNELNNIENGDLYNLHSFSMCAHNGTHVDAPSHFIKDGKNIDEIGLDAFVGECYVARHEGEVTAVDAAQILAQALKVGAKERILIAGKAVMTAEAARVFVEAKLKLYGNESQKVGPEDAPVEVHRIMLGAGIVLLEGVVLKEVEAGKYFLSAAPLNFKGFEGAPCRAFLMK